MSSSLPREQEIDGLRSLAIVPVVLYHAGWSIFPGGFVGVDVFFVISGYLITRILDRELAAQDFSLWRFYERRARRIMPALLVVFAASSLLALALLLPRDLILFCKSLLYATLSASNVFFSLQTNYFAPDANSYALLHTWSLAVEEQFYLLFPFVLLLAAKSGRQRRKRIVAGICTVSFVLCVVVSPIYNAFAFYLPVTRAWELMVGALLALGAVPEVKPGPLRQALASLSLAAIAGTVLVVHEGGGFPGWIAAVPVLGTAGLIHFSAGTYVGKVLRQPLLVGTGLISYSLYLWHWPLLVFASDWLFRPLSIWESSAVVVLSSGLAVATWKFVEQPFRDRSRWRRKQIFAATAAGITICATASLAGIYGNGLEQRVPAEVRRLEAFAGDVSPKRENCHDTDNQLSPERACALGAEAPPTTAVWGDSHGVELAYALGELAKANGASVLQLSSSSCPPTLGYQPGSRPNCDTRNHAVLAHLLAHPEIGTVILVALRQNDRKSYLDRVFPGFEEAIRTLREAGKTIVVVYPTPRDGQSVPERLAREQWHLGTFRSELYGLEEYQRRLANTLSRLDDLAQKYGLIAVKPTDVYCPNGECLTYLNGEALFFDAHHPSLSGARLIARRIVDALVRAGA